MARLRDWFALGRSTLSSFRASDVSELYARDWPETQKMLLSEQADEIAREKRRLRRWLRTASALLYGLAQRLAPGRRIIFVTALFAFLYAVITYPDPLHRFEISLTLVLSFLGILFLLAIELIDKIRYRDELELARELQSSLVPKEPPQTEAYEVAAFNAIANTVGGDLYDFVLLPDGALAILFGDASGHGMAAGLVMAVAHAAFRTQLDVDPSPRAVVSALNRLLCRTGGPRSFFAGCYLLLLPDGSYRAIVAGHPPVLVVSTTGRVTNRIGRGSYPLGIKQGLLWEEECGQLAPNEQLLLHSDGLAEARNANGREFTYEFVEAIASWNPNSTAHRTVDTIVSEWRLFTRDLRPEDDVSVAAVRFLAPKPAVQEAGVLSAAERGSG